MPIRCQNKNCLSNINPQGAPHRIFWDKKKKANVCRRCGWQDRNLPPVKEEKVVITRIERVLITEDSFDYPINDDIIKNTVIELTKSVDDELMVIAAELINKKL